MKRLVLHLGLALLCVCALRDLAAVVSPPARLPRENLLLWRDDANVTHPVRTAADWQKRRAEILRGMQSVMGTLPGAEKRCPLDVKVEGETDCGSYVRRSITYQAEPGERVPAYLCIPKAALDSQRKFPAVLCLHPTDNVTGYGVVVGIGGKPNRQYAAELAERGYVTIAPSYPLLAKYQPDLKALGYASGTMKAIWNNIRALDLFESLPFVKRDGFGVIGHSLGGHNSVYTAVFDERIIAVVSSCGLDSYCDYYAGNPAVWAPEKGWCQTRYMPRLLEYAGRLAEIPFDFHEMIGALAPRHVFINAPLKDKNFQWQSVDRVVAAASQIYRLYGKLERLRVEHPDCPHDFPDDMRAIAYQLFDSVLNADATQTGRTQALYRELLAIFPEDRQGFSKDADKNAGGPELVADHQPMTYGFVLSAESLRYRFDHNAESARRVRKAARWLVENRDLDGDGKPGWGLPQAWPAWGHAPNPHHQPYTITTAVVLNGLLDSLALRDFWSAAERDEMLALCVQVAMRWCREMWSEGYSGGYFWYSPSPLDDIFGVNAPAMFLGALARLLHEHGDRFSDTDRQLARRRCDALARAIVNTVQLHDGKPFWLYAPLPNKLNHERFEDLMHHVYTLWGIEGYRDAGGKVALPWSRAQALQSLGHFWKDGGITENDQDRPDKKTPSPAPARLCGAGMLLLGYAAWGNPQRGADVVEWINKQCGPWPQLRHSPAGKADTVYLRDCAHVLAGLARLNYSPKSSNWIQNGDFESDQPSLWPGTSRAQRDAEGESGKPEHATVHSGKGALRLETSAGKTRVSARYSGPVELNQEEAETIMASFWMRFDAKRQTGPIRGGMTFLVEMADGTLLAWYGPFELNASEMGSWVYREHRWKPKAPVVRIRPSVYLQGCEGSVCVDDLYLGPPVELPPPPRTTIPLAVTSAGGRVAFGSLCPNAHVFHLSGTNTANLELTCNVDVKKTAPVYLTSAWGSQYWTLYSPPRCELAQIFTDERIDLSKPGPQTVRVRMSGFAKGASDLAPSGYAFLTDCTKNFLIYSTEKPNSWDTMKCEVLSRALGPTGVAAPFSLADLRSYRLNIAVRNGKVKPTLTDAQNNVVPLYGLDLRTEAGVSLVPGIAEDGVPTGDYLFPSNIVSELKITGKVRLATPSGIKEELIEGTVSPTTSRSIQPVLARLDLLGWGTPSYEFSTKSSHGSQSMRQEIADAKAAGITKLLIHARTSRETLYPSRIALPSTITEGDALALATAEGKKQGVDIYAAYILGVAQPGDLKAHPDWAMIGRNGKLEDWYCYNNPDVRAFHASLLAEIVTRYDVAGVALDFVRPGGGCFCPRCASGFEAKFHKSLKDVDHYDNDWRTWQRESITDYVRLLREALRKVRPTAQLAGYVWARFAPDKDRAGQDWPRWIKENLMDFVAVGQYTPSSPWFRAECHALRVIADRELGGHTERIYPLLGVGYIHHVNPSHAAAAAVIGRHLQAAREEGMQAAGYFAFYEIRPHSVSQRFAKHAQE